MFVGKSVCKAFIRKKKIESFGSGCGSVGRAVASKTRGPWFKSSQWHKFIQNMFYLPTYLLLAVGKMKIKKKEAGNSSIA